MHGELLNLCWDKDIFIKFVKSEAKQWMQIVLPDRLPL